MGRRIRSQSRMRSASVSRSGIAGHVLSGGLELDGADGNERRFFVAEDENTLAAGHLATGFVRGPFRGAAETRLIVVDQISVRIKHGDEDGRVLHAAAEIGGSFDGGGQ